MSLSQQQKADIRTSFSHISDADDFAQRFYNRLFEIDPTTRRLFKQDMRDQRKKLMQTLIVVVNGLDSIDGLVPAIQELGKRHVHYGVTEGHWQSVGAALLWALNDALGDERFTDDTRSAWASAYNLIASVALAAAHESA